MGEKVRKWILALLPVGGLLVWFSYQPLIYLGSVAGANLEISVIHIWLVILAGLGLVSLFCSGLSMASFVEKCKALFRDKWLVAFAVFVGWNWLSLIWTANFVRGVLAAGIITAVFVLALVISPAGRSEPKSVAREKERRDLVQKSVMFFAVGGAAAGVMAIWQVLGEAMGASEVWTLLPLNYRSAVFGFARPTAFAQEPQFFASMLTVGIIGIFAIFVRREVFVKERWRGWGLGMILGLMTISMVLAMSRGAFLGLGLGLVVILVYFLRKKRFLWRELLKGVAILVGAGVLGLVLVGFAAGINKKNEVGFGEAVNGWVNQMSLGILGGKNEEKEASEGQNEVNSKEGNLHYIINNLKSQVIYDSWHINDSKSQDNVGYVEASTDERMHSNEMAVRALGEHPVLGVGIGGSGQYRFDNYSEPNNYSINYNEYLEVLSELGLVGAGIFVFWMVLGIKKVKNAVGWAILAGILGQWLFFAGYPNSLPTLIILVYVVQLGYGKAETWKKTGA